MLRRFYDWLITLSGARRAPWILALISFAESSFFPIPPDILLIPMCLAKRRQALFMLKRLYVSLGGGGWLGYAVGYYLWEAIGVWIVRTYGLTQQFDVFQKGFSEYGWWIILIKGMTPIPYKLITIASGVANFPLLVFTFASILSRAMRFFLVAGLLYRYGERVRLFIEKYLAWLTTAFAVALVGAFCYSLTFEDQ